jgi:hypothetical protein
VPWYEAGEFSYFAPTGSIFVTQLLMMGWAETRRWLDIKVRLLHRNPPAPSPTLP